MTEDKIVPPYEELANKIVKNLTPEGFDCSSFEVERGNPTELVGRRYMPASPFFSNIEQKNVEFFCKENRD